MNMIFIWRGNLLRKQRKNVENRIWNFKQKTQNNSSSAFKSIKSDKFRTVWMTDDDDDVIGG